MESYKIEISEKTLEDIIFDCLTGKNPKLEKRVNLSKILFTNVDKHAIKFKKVFRQLHIGNYGIADIVCLNIEKNNKNRFYNYYFNVIELKKDVIDCSTLIQAATYAKGIKEYLPDDYRNFYFKITLIGNKALINNNWVYLFDVLELNKHVSVYEYSMNEFGINISDIQLCDYSLVNHGFKNIE